MSILADNRRLAPSAEVELFELHLAAIGGDAEPVRFHNGTNELKTSVVWQGHTYGYIPVEAEGFSCTGQGQLPRPVLRIGNVDGVMSVLARDLDDLVGAWFFRKRTLVRYLDAANFAAGNPEADPYAAYPDDIYIVSQKKNENRVHIEWELAAACDAHGVLLPLQVIIEKCPWEYADGDECPWVPAPGAYYDADDNPVADAALDECGQRLSSCQARYGYGNSVLPFGGFPMAGRY